MSRSTRFEQIRDRVVTEYRIEPTNPQERNWWRKFAPKWRNRVGLPRLTAEAAVSEANGLVWSVNPAIFRTDPDVAEKLQAAREAVDDLAIALGRSNWDRYNGSGS